MFSKWSSRIALLAGAALAGLLAQEMPLDSHSSVKINLPPDSPLHLVTADWGESRALGRGSAIELDLHMGLTLRNGNANNTVRGVTLLVQAQEFTPGGRASVSLSSLNVGPGQIFTMPVEVKLLRPGRSGGGPLVQVNLDGVLFRDLTFYGDNHLDSRRSLTAYELEAQRDREYFKKVLAAYGQQGLQRDVLMSLARQKERPRLDVGVTVGRGGRSVGSAAAGGEHVAQFAFLRFPDSPVEPIQGSAQIAGNEARSPNIQVRNRSGKNVRYVEIGWIVKDAKGAEFMAASVPASNPGLKLEPGHTANVLQDTALRFTSKGAPVPIAGMTGFVSQVEYADNTVWVPNRASLENAHLLRVLAPSIEEQRLTDLYQRKGLKALVDELSKY